MAGVMISFGFWYTQHYYQAVVMAAFSVILGWPFVALVFVPMGNSPLSRSLSLPLVSRHIPWVNCA